jgi:hypothetical protein
MSAWIVVPNGSFENRRLRAMRAPPSVTLQGPEQTARRRLAAAQEPG